MGDYVMKNNNIFKHKLILIFNGILSVIGACMLFINLSYIEYSFLFGDVTRNMRKNYAILGYSFSTDTYDMFERFKSKGNISVIGAIILVACIIVFLIIYFANLKQKSISIQKSILETVQNDNTNDSIENKLLKLEKLKEMNLITTAEYETKRQNIIDNI